MNKENRGKEQKQGQDVAHRRSTVYNLFVLALIIFSFVVMAGVLVGPDTRQVIYRVDVLVCAVLFADFVRNLWRAPNRYLRGKDRDEMIEETRQAPAKTALLTITIAGFVLITVASLLILWLERGATGADIETGAEAFWWAVVTVTSVPYGDYAPVTFPGRFLAIVLRAFGLIILAVLTTFVAETVLGLQTGQEEMVEIMREENAIIRNELAELKEFLKQQGGADGDEA